MTAELTGITPRPYQDDAYTWATRRAEAVVCLPTGTGKTLVGCMWARTRLRSPDVDRILILEPYRFLVAKTCAYYTEYTTIPTTKLDGTVTPPSRAPQWQDSDIVVTMLQTAVNDATHLDFDDVIIDECHHTTGQHAFAQLPNLVEFPYKLGLSATIPTSKEQEIRTAIGRIHRRYWTDLPDEHVPDRIGSIYDYSTLTRTLPSSTSLKTRDVTLPGHGSLAPQRSASGCCAVTAHSLVKTGCV